MRRLPVVAVLLLGIASLAVFADPAADTSWSFDRDAADAPAAGWTTEIGEWAVTADETAPSPGHALEQRAKSSNATYNVALAGEPVLADLTLSVRFKSVSGEVDQGGGLVWRARDARNYYIARYNPLEANFRLYKVVDGKRTQLGSADVDEGEGWHTLEVTMTGATISCVLNGKTTLTAEDASLAEPGRIGLWTKADARTRFDDVKVRATAAAPGK